MTVALLCEINMGLFEENLFLPFLCNSLCLPSILPEANATTEPYYKIMLVQKKGITAWIMFIIYTSAGQQDVRVWEHNQKNDFHGNNITFLTHLPRSCKEQNWQKF